MGMAAMSPARRARQSAIMRERWATRRDDMTAAIRGGDHTNKRGWKPYHEQAGHDGGYSAALADGAHDGAYAIVRTLDYWEALYEPPWDIRWDRVAGAGYRPQTTPPPQTGTDEPWFAPKPPPLRPPAPPPPRPHPAAWWAERIARALERDARQAHQRAYQRQYQARRKAAEAARCAAWRTPPPVVRRCDICGRAPVCPAAMAQRCPPCLAIFGTREAE
jgi:hypothetical protein